MVSQPVHIKRSEKIRTFTYSLQLGMILFPLGKPIFAHLGSAGISIFYVSTIVSQLTFSSGSTFKGAVGSELVSYFDQ